MGRNVTAILVSCALLVSSSMVIAAQFKMLCGSAFEKVSGCTILMTGPIVTGDAKRLSASIAVVPPHTGLYRVLLLDSPGGDVDEALRIAQVVRRAVLETSTHRIDEVSNAALGLFSTPCASSCFLVWAAGARREHHSSPTGPAVRDGKRFWKQPSGLGLHRPFLSRGAYSSADVSEIAHRQQQATVAVKAYLIREAIPDTLIEEMMRRSSQEIFWLDSAEQNFPPIPETAPWFEELLISRCGFDPVRQREQQDRYWRVFQGKHENIEATKRFTETDSAYRSYVEWKQGVNHCLYEDIRRSSQKGFRQSPK